EATLETRKLLGERAFIAWRKLPRSFNAVIENTMLNVWRIAPKGSLSQLGGKKFQLLAKILGAEKAAHIFRRWQRPLYAKLQTIGANELESLASELTKNLLAP
ncbi:hypothetical protein OAO01_09350, partial [Oligoflexia bacterium]|nr:hypothetical protein [Oligoflexia bacterium]